MAAVGERIRRFFRRVHDTNKMSKDEILTAMQHIVATAGNKADLHDLSVWVSMDLLGDYYQLAKTGSISRKSFDDVFFAWLNTGTPLDSNSLWNRVILKR